MHSSQKGQQSNFKLIANLICGDLPPVSHNPDDTQTKARGMSQHRTQTLQLTLKIRALFLEH